MKGATKPTITKLPSFLNNRDCYSDYLVFNLTNQKKT